MRWRDGNLRVGVALEILSYVSDKKDGNCVPVRAGFADVSATSKWIVWLVANQVGYWRLESVLESSRPAQCWLILNSCCSAAAE